MTTKISGTYLVNNYASVCEKLEAGEEFLVHYRATRNHKGVDMLLKAYQKGTAVDIWKSMNDLRKPHFPNLFREFNTVGLKRNKSNYATAVLAAPEEDIS